MSVGAITCDRPAVLDKLDKQYTHCGVKRYTA